MKRIRELAHLPVTSISGYGRDETDPREFEMGVRPTKSTGHSRRSEFVAQVQAVLRSWAYRPYRPRMKGKVGTARPPEPCHFTRIASRFGTAESDLV